MKSFLFLCLLIFLFGCGKELEPSEYGNDIEKTDSAISLEIEDDSLSAPPERISILIKNQSDVSITVGLEYLVEKYDSKQDKWYQVPFKKDAAFKDIAMIMEPNSESEDAIQLDILDSKLKEGNYRLIKVLSADGDGIVVYDTFAIE